MKLEYHLNAVKMKWPQANELAELRGTDWRLPTRAEVIEHSAAILLINEDLAAQFLPYVWTADLGSSTWGGSINSSLKTLATTQDGKLTGIDAWMVDLKTGRELCAMKSRTAYVVLVRNVGSQR